MIETFPLDGAGLEGVWRTEYPNPEETGPDMLWGYYICLGGCVFETRVLNSPEGPALICVDCLPPDAEAVALPDAWLGKTLRGIRLAFLAETEEKTLALDFGAAQYLHFYPLSEVYPASEMCLDECFGDEVFSLALGGRFPQSAGFPDSVRKYYRRNHRLQTCGVFLIVAAVCCGLFQDWNMGLMVLILGILIYITGTVLNLRKMPCPWCGMKGVSSFGFAAGDLYCDNCHNVSRLEE